MGKDKKIIIVGAGLCGTLLAIRMAQRGLEVALYEKRSDMRREEVDAGRSINLALSDRGLMALDTAGLKEVVKKNTIPMKGRLVHPLNGQSFLSPYSGRSENYINSVSRSGLNSLLLDDLEGYDRVDVHFDSKVQKVNVAEASIEYVTKGEKKFDSGAVVIGTDGAGSAVRGSLMGLSTEILFNYSQDFLRHGYKELSILPAENGGWKIEKEALHIWPRQDFMIIALPNLDGSFTLTMFHPFDTELGFNQLDSEEKLVAFFEEYYPSLLPHIPHYREEYFENPVGTLGTIKCFPWQANGKLLLMGDASHAVVPFYGQGMNASLEDVRIFDELFDSHGDDWESLFVEFQNQRKENTDAIADLAIENYFEMRDHVDDEAFIRKREVEMRLEQSYPDYFSKYSQVTFRPELAYSKAMVRGRKQDQLLLDLCKSDAFEEVPLEDVYKLLKAIEV